MTLPVFETDRLTLRALTAQDFDDMYAYAQDIEVALPGMWQPYPSEEEARADFARILGHYERGLMWWALEHKPDGKMIGRVQLGDYDDEDAHAELSYALNRHYWRRGLVSEAILPVLRYGFETLNLNRISAKVFTDNAASIGLLEKLGMMREGCLREYRGTRGRLEDVYIYALLRREWQP